jgi:hypothetical protein
VIDPAAFEMLTPVPAVNVEATGARPVEPMINWPSVNVWLAIVFDAPPIKTAFCVVVVAVNVPAPS